jgi:sec-independent protein translocase protein TatA
MGSFSVWHWLIVLIIVLIFFGRGKIPDLMGDVAKGIKSFKKGMADDETNDAPPPPPVSGKTVDHQREETK